MLERCLYFAMFSARLFPISIINIHICVKIPVLKTMEPTFLSPTKVLNLFHEVRK